MGTFKIASRYLLEVKLTGQNVLVLLDYAFLEVNETPLPNSGYSYASLRGNKGKCYLQWFYFTLL